MSTFKTPGVYIVELNVSPAPVVAAPTSVPVFIGYTPRAVDALGRDCTNRAMRIASYAEFAAMYLPENTTDFSTHYAVLPKSEVKGNAPVLKLGGQAFVVTPDPDTVYYTVNSVKMFFLNGGGPAYVISLGNYGPASGQFQKTFDDPIINKNVHSEAYLKAMALLEKEYEPAVCVMPDAVLSDSDGYAQVINAALTMAQDTGRYFCLFDIRCPVPPVQDNYQEAITQFRAAIAPQSDRNARSYGASYFPWLNSTLYQDDVPDYRNIGDGELTSLAELLAPELQENPALAAFLQQTAIATTLAPKEIHQKLLSMSTGYSAIIAAVRQQAFLVPTTGAIAGVYATVDQNRAVWNAPANVALQGVSSLPLAISDTQQADLLDMHHQGIAVNAIRSFPSLGLLVWGARTLASNDNDWRYIHTRRTLIMLEQSIKAIAMQYVFEPNDANTWTAVNASVSNFLTGIWQQGGLFGQGPQDAFQVKIGLGSTMTEDDLLNGNMCILIEVALIRPAEFLVITIQQQMAAG
ncbi:phage tail sheath family protein [Undibacterium luofuense]|uniref:Phage tail sheath family protein n=1 Tax=Undibacterium luofuense TaxID=2828733 RepID=A0A941I689_9BURK|nr:phage tail sheath C-terminal domain-containing protein [Undibacterium luofuense]MBR7781584.1 phage tail sheath family protein [Undibacterium luofuense]